MPGKGQTTDRTQRFMSKVRRDRWEHWRWTAFVGPQGYGMFAWSGSRSIGAHRAAWRLFRGEIPDDHDIHHLCRVRDCVNPEHLQCVSHEEHNGVLHAAGLRRRITVCKHGHPMEGDNIAWTTAHTTEYPEGYRARYCRTCAVERLRAMRAAGYVAPDRRR